MVSICLPAVTEKVGIVFHISNCKYFASFFVPVSQQNLVSTCGIELQVAFSLLYG